MTIGNDHELYMYNIRQIFCVKVVFRQADITSVWYLTF